MPGRTQAIVAAGALVAVGFATSLRFRSSGEEGRPGARAAATAEALRAIEPDGPFIPTTESTRDRAAPAPSLPTVPSAIAEPAIAAPAPSILKSYGAGRHCFEMGAHDDDDDDARGSIVLDVNVDGTAIVSRSVESEQNREPLGAYRLSGSGRFVAPFGLVVEGKREFKDGAAPEAVSERWLLSPQSVAVGSDRLRYARVECGNRAAALAPPRKDPLAGLRIGVDQDVRFKPGASGAELKGAVIRGQRDIYRVEVSAGQLMESTIRSLESNAVFGLVSPDGVLLEREATALEIATRAGTYLFVVGGTRGNATYTLTVIVD